jgi:putative ABC transport system permease protein
LSVLFDQVLLVLLTLTILATVGAVLVILTGLIALRRRATEDLAMLRALGVQPGQIIRTGALETGIVVMTSGACAMIAGTIIALIAAFAIGSMQATAIAGLVGPVGLGSFGVICVIGFGGGWILQAASLRSQSGWRG